MSSTRILPVALTIVVAFMTSPVFATAAEVRPPGKRVASTRVWIDTDPALGMLFRDADDGFALLQALHSPELAIAGVSICRGNSSIPDGTRIARQLTDRWAESHAREAPQIRPGRTDGAGPSPAANALASALSKGRLTYVALGPLTNLAEFLRHFPNSADRIERVIFIGGQLPGATFRAGGWNPHRFTDANFIKDPEAARCVLNSRIPITLIPIDVARGIGLTPAEFQTLRNSRGCPQWVARQAGAWFFCWRLFFGVREAPVFDALALLRLTHPAALQESPATCLIGQTRGDAALLVNVGSRDSRVRVVTGFCPEARHYFLSGILCDKAHAISCK